MDEGLVNIIIAVIGLLGLIITSVIVPYFKSKTTEKQRSNVFTLVTFAVEAAEQLLKAEDLSGTKRKEYVVRYLSSKGVKLTVQDLEVFIEAAVKELNIIQVKALE